MTRLNLRHHAIAALAIVAVMAAVAYLPILAALVMRAMQ